MQIEELLMKALTSYDNSRARSNQVEIGVSQLGGCRKQVWLQLQGTPTENETVKLPALMGTAIHDMIEKAMAQYHADEFAHDYTIWLEREVKHENLPPGHVDMYIPEIGAVIDWKSNKLKSLDYFPSKQQRWQVHTYAWLLEKMGESPKTVTLFGIPRDGDERQLKVHTEAYNPEIAEEAIAWYMETTAMETAPAPERYALQWCQHYCPFYGKACGGKEDKETSTITDNDQIAAVERYKVLNQQIKLLESELDGVKVFLEGVSGVTPSGTKIVWTTVQGRKALDVEAVAQFFEKHGEELTYKQGNSYMKLVVK